MAQDTSAAEGGFVNLPHGRIHAIIRGQGPDLVLIHGANGNARDFSFELIDRLAGEFRVIAFDRPGFGFSDAFDGPESPVAQADLLRDAAAALGVERPLVLGHSYGGAVALAWALRAGDAVAGLALLAPATHPWPGELGLWYRLTDTVLGQYLILPAVARLAPRRSVERALAGVFSPDPVPEGYLDHLGLDLTLRAAQLALNAQQVNNLRGYLQAMSPGYPALTLPIEVLHGTEDTTVWLPYHAERLIADIDSARLTLLEGTGHMPHHARPESVVEAVRRAAERAGLR
ncbi:MAG: alpha/beta hydrolase [Pararhodobacter sp.]|nr:alpha/beta hydrolase [Pararhodobacter sp.]